MVKSIFILSALLLLGGCASPGGSPLVDLTDPGWTVRQGQALWKPGPDKPEIAGDVIISTHPTGSSYIQFSKTLPILSGRISPGGWSFEVTAENKQYGGRGNPPKRIIWLQLLRALEGHEIAGRWTVARPSPEFVSLENEFGDERLEVQLQK